MRSPCLFLSLLVSITARALALALPAGVSRSALKAVAPPGPGPWPPSVCDPSETGSNLQERQQAALVDWSILFYQNKDVIGSFDRWIPGQWINHSPGAGQGREDAIRRLTALFQDPTVSMEPHTAFAGEGFAFVHFKFSFPSINTTFSAWHGFRFEGLCFVEHWDGVQQILGNEPNPIAFF